VEIPPEIPTSGENTDGGFLSGADVSFFEAFLQATNACRARHGVPPLRYSNVLASQAQDWSDFLARRKTGMEHGDMTLRGTHTIGGVTYPAGTRLGQNLAWGMNSNGRGRHVQTGVEANQIWYDEIAFYDWANPERSLDPTEQIFHFTQVVWASTQFVGLGVATNGNETYITANYLAGGNMLGRFGTEVKPLVSTL